MKKRVFHGVDLNVDYAALIKEEVDSEKRQMLLDKRAFKIGCFIRERDACVGREVVTRDYRLHMINEVKGDCIENMVFVLSDLKGKKKECSVLDLTFPSEVKLERDFDAIMFSILTAMGFYEKVRVKKPGWFVLVDRILEMEAENLRRGEG